MVRNVEIEKELLDSLIEEACLFVCFYSEGTVDLDKIIKDLLTKLPSLEKSEFCRIRALFLKIGGPVSANQEGVLSYS